MVPVKYKVLIDWKKMQLVTTITIRMNSVHETANRG